MEVIQRLDDLIGKYRSMEQSFAQQARGPMGQTNARAANICGQIVNDLTQWRMSIPPQG